MIPIRSGLRILFDENPSVELRSSLSKKIDDFNNLSVPYEHERFAFLLYDTANYLVGGVSGILYWDWVFIESLWVDDMLRGNGLGIELMKHAETHAVSRGCHAAWLDTFQARAFYEKCGYEVFGALDNYPAGQQRWFLKKRLLQ